MGALLQGFEGIPSELRADELSRNMGDVFSDVMTASPVVRQYIRRSLLEATPASQTIFDELLALINASLDQLQRAGGLQEGSDPAWRPYQLLFVILGTLLLEPAVQSHFDQAVFERSSVASVPQPTTTSSPVECCAPRRMPHPRGRSLENHR